MSTHRLHELRLNSSMACSTSHCASPSCAPLRVQARSQQHHEQRKEEQQQPVLQASSVILSSRRSGLVAALVASASTLLAAGDAQATKLGTSVDRAWTAVGGGPPDLFFPEPFAGRWLVESTLIKVEQPLGVEFVPDQRVVQRAMREDLNKPMRYGCAFAPNAAGQVVADRAYNTAALLRAYYGGSSSSGGAAANSGTTGGGTGGDLGTNAAASAATARASNSEQSLQRRIRWDINDPNSLAVDLPGGTSVFTRVTKRSEELPTPDSILTSEFFEQVFDSPEALRPKVKASQCFTKYKFRDERAATAAGGPAIVATQVVSDYLTPDDDAMLIMRAAGKPVVVYTYRMAFYRQEEEDGPRGV